MREIAVTEAKAKLPEFINEVERGASFRITRHGRPVARLVPEQAERERAADEAVASILAIRRRTKPMTTEEILSARDEGRRF
ncbi:MAG: type II toxin-antitoxin system prevent-host-death family antitoxin [Terracidiphilus sp.]